MQVEPLDLSRLKVFPLAERVSLTRADDILRDPESAPPPCCERNSALIQEAAERIRDARGRDATVMLIYGAHLLRNGAAKILEQMMAASWLTHLATNGAGTIHDWEYAWLGASTESIEMDATSGHCGAWHETALAIHLAVMTGAMDGLGYGQSLGRLIIDDGAIVPAVRELERAIASDPKHVLTSARADLLNAILAHGWPAGRWAIDHRWKRASILAQAWQHQVPLTVHPGIGYDSITKHPVFSGSAIGRAGEWDFKLFSGSVARLEGGVVLSIGSAIMGPQVFEKSISCVNNLRLQAGLPVLRDHTIFVVDIQDGGGWDWTQGEPPKKNPAYYLRFCKSYSRMGGTMHYLQCENVAFIHNLYHELSRR
jgi:hypothetical protein